MGDQARGKGVPHPVQFCGNEGLELAETVPDFDAGKSLHRPVLPGNVGLLERRRGRIGQVGHECKSAGILHDAHEVCRIGGQGCHLGSGSQDQQVILLRVAVLVMHFLADEHEDFPPVAGNVAPHVAHKHIVIGHDDCVEARLESGRGNVTMAAASIGIAGVHMQVDDDLVHGEECPGSVG